MNKKAYIIIAAVLVIAGIALLLYKLAGMETRVLPVQGNAAVSGARDVKEEKDLISKADQLAAGGDLLKAKEMYKRIVEKFPASSNMAKIQEALDSVNVKILFSDIETPDSFVYEVQKGDSLTKIAKKFTTTVELIKKANDLKADLLRIGEKLKITKARFNIVVDRSQNILMLKSGQEILKTYNVSTGKNNCTPLGTFKITNKIINPPWYPPTGGVIPSGDPKNVLGSRWMGISKEGYGIHGTTQPESIGKSVTEGCVRLKNSDAEELYAIVPEGAEVVIVD